MALLASLTLAALGARPWYEYLDTLQNLIADALSRNGSESTVVRDAVAAGARILPNETVPWDKIT